MRRTRTVLAALVAAVIGLAAAVTAGASPPDRVVAGFFASWDIYGRGYYVKDLPADGVSHLYYAFARPAGPNDTFGYADGTCAPGDIWADFEQVHWDGSATVDGKADNYPDQTLYGNFDELRKLKAAHPNLKILMSVGGWTFSKYFSDVAATAASRARFAASCIDTFVKGNIPYPADAWRWPWNAGGPGSAAGIFDGIDIDWEYPGVDPGNGADHSPADRQNATLLLQELRRQLDVAGAQTGKHYLLTADLPAGNVHSTGSWDLAAVARTVDWINVMAFDFHGPWDAQTNFNSPFGLDPLDPTPLDQRPTWNTTGTVAYYEANGVPADKIVLGTPFYARQYTHVPATNDGLYQPFDDTGLDPNTLQWDLTPTPTYRDLIDVAKIVTPSSSIGNDAKGLQGFTRSWDPLAGEPWLYRARDQRFITYDDPHSIAERTQLIRSGQLHGAMVWELSQDSNDHALLDALSPLLR